MKRGIPKLQYFHTKLAETWTVLLFPHRTYMHQVLLPLLCQCHQIDTKSCKDTEHTYGHQLRSRHLTFDKGRRWKGRRQVDPGAVAKKGIFADCWQRGKESGNLYCLSKLSKTLFSFICILSLLKTKFSAQHLRSGSQRFKSYRSTFQQMKVTKSWCNERGFV